MTKKVETKNEIKPVQIPPALRRKRSFNEIKAALSDALTVNDYERVSKQKAYLNKEVPRLRLAVDSSNKNFSSEIELVSFRNLRAHLAWIQIASRSCSNLLCLLERYDKVVTIGAFSKISDLRNDVLEASPSARNEALKAAETARELRSELLKKMQVYGEEVSRIEGSQISRADASA